jgi:hypothetical protein
MFDESIAVIEEIPENIFCTTVPSSQLASSAANPSPLPSNGYGVNAATFEIGI